MMLSLVGLALLSIRAGAAGARAAFDPRLAEVAPVLADAALACVEREYPYNPGHYLESAEDLETPIALHPAFYGCYDHHSAVHNHFLLVRLMRLLPALPQNTAARSVLSRHLSAASIATELEYFQERVSFERPYGWAWLFALSAELARLESTGDSDAATWRSNLAPLVTVLSERFASFLQNQTFPIRSGVHSSTAFAFALSADYARTEGDAGLLGALRTHGDRYFGGDTNIPAHYEPSGEEFLSPALTEAVAVHQLSTNESAYALWFDGFLPGLRSGVPAQILTPIFVSDRSDYKIVHLDGLNLSRAWALRYLATMVDSVGEDSAFVQMLEESANAHYAESGPFVVTGDYGGDHWLPTFCLMFLSLAPPAVQ